jgi:hypothetical protein
MCASLRRADDARVVRAERTRRHASVRPLSNPKPIWNIDGMPGTNQSITFLLDDSPCHR